MDKTIKISNITIVENNVIISLDRHNELLANEKKLKENTVFTKSSWGWSSNYETVYTNDEAVKELLKDLIESREETKKLEREKNALITDKDELLKQKKHYSWREIFIIFINKFFCKTEK